MSASIFDTTLDAPDIVKVASHITDEPWFEIHPKKLNYIFEPEKIALSFSRLQTLRNCPREFACKELGGQGSFQPSIHTAYGHAFGAGVQELFRSGSLHKAFLAALEAWDFPYFDDPWGSVKHKSFFHATASLEQWYYTVFPVLDEEFELAYFDGRPGIELFVYMAIGDTYSYQIHIDLVLQNRLTREFVVTEIKTSGMVQQRANWENSLQTLGYHTCINAISKQHGIQAVSPTILYIVQQTGKLGDPAADHGFYVFDFAKGDNAPAEFMMDLGAQISVIDLYLQHKYFPKYGHNCVRFGRPCPLFGVCDSMPTSGASADVQHYENNDLTTADYVIDFESVVNILEP